MDLGKVARPLAGFILFFSLSMLLPLAVSFSEDSDYATTQAFATGIVAALVVALLLWVGGRKSTSDLYRREGLTVVGLAWVFAGALAAIPFERSGAIPSGVDAFFESISGLTTTGATVLGTTNTDIESLPPSVLLWRSMLQWMGGMGIILVFIVLLPAMGVTGSRLLSSEQVGVSDETRRPRMIERARALFFVYALLTTFGGIAYWMVGLQPFDAVCHAFTTLASGGFSTNNFSIGGFQNAGVELVAIVFMFLAGCNFLLLAYVLRHGGKTTGALHSSEFKLYLGLTLVIILGMTLSLWTWGQPVTEEELGVTKDYSSFFTCVRYASFQTVSILTSTGYATANYVEWPKPALYLLVLCMFIGGCTGSTAGGFKVLRILVCAKLVGNALRHFVRPRTVETFRVGGEAIPDRVVIGILALLLLWLATVAAGTLVLSLDPDLDIVSAFTASLAMMGCIGPAFGDAVHTAAGSGIDVGPYGGYGELQTGAKLFMSLQMILGRLEILAPFALLTPGFWRR